MALSSNMVLLLILKFWLIIIGVTRVASEVNLIQITEPVDHSECPTWDPRNGVLYFVNLHQGEIYRYKYETRELKSIKLDGEIAPVLQSKNDPNVLIAGLNLSIVAVEWDGESPPSDTRILADLPGEYPTSRVNEGKADKNGRLWIGTMGFEDSDGNTLPDKGVLYEVTCANIASPEVVIAPVNISNGLAWNKANDKFFYIDSPTRQVVGYSYNETTGEINNKFVLFDVADYNLALAGHPDGMTIDENDNLWIALYLGSAVIHVNSSTGELLQVIPIPARDVTSTMWGGPDLDVLFVTTSRISLTEEQQQQQPAAGAVFAISGLETKGVPVYQVDLLQSIEDDACGN